MNKHEYEERYFLSPHTHKIEKKRNKNKNTCNLEQIGITIVLIEILQSKLLKLV